MPHKTNNLGSLDDNQTVKKNCIAPTETPKQDLGDLKSCSVNKICSEYPEEACNEGKLGDLGSHTIKIQKTIPIQINGRIIKLPITDCLAVLSIQQGGVEVGHWNGTFWSIKQCIPPTLCEALTGKTWAQIKTCLSPEIIEDAVQDICPECSPLILTFQDNEFELINEPCGKTVNIDCDTLINGVVFATTAPVDFGGVYLPSGTLNGRNTYQHKTLTCKTIRYDFDAGFGGFLWIAECAISGNILYSDFPNDAMYPWGFLWQGEDLTSQATVSQACCNGGSTEPATWELRDTDGNVLQTGSIPAGGSAVIVAPDALISVNGVSFPSIPSGGSDNIQVRQSSGSTLIGSKQGSHWRISDSVITLKDTANNTLSTTNVKATDAEDVIAPDATATLNGNAFLTIPSGGSENIILQDQASTPIVPSSVVGSTVTVNVPKDLFIYTEIKGTTGSKDFAEWTAKAPQVGTIINIDAGGVTSLVVLKNTNPVTAPFSIALNDVIRFEFDSTTLDHTITLEGNYV